MSCALRGAWLMVAGDRGNLMPAIHILCTYIVISYDPLTTQWSCADHVLNTHSKKPQAHAPYIGSITHCPFAHCSLRNAPPSTPPHLGVTCYWKPDHTFLLLTHSPPATISSDYRYYTISGQSSAASMPQAGRAIFTLRYGAVPSS